jgi:two-component system LytT family response regulator
VNRREVVAHALQGGGQVPPESEVKRLRSAIVGPARARSEYLKRIPLRSNDGLVLVPTNRVMTVAADLERLIITTTDQVRHTILYRLKDLEALLDPSEFVRLSRGLIVNLNAIARLAPGPAGTSRAILENGQELGVSRKQTVRLRRVLNEFLR